MAVLSWGKCVINHATSINGVPANAWGGLDTPKEDTTKLSTTAGSDMTATQEGGNYVDAKNNKSTYQLEFDLFVKKGKDRPLLDDDGNIPGEHAWRIIPFDKLCEGIQIDRSVVRVEESFSTADGKMLHYVIRVLKPKSGKSIKQYTAGDAITMSSTTEMRLLSNGMLRLN